MRETFAYATREERDEMAAALGTPIARYESGLPFPWIVTGFHGGARVIMPTTGR